jgi:hypothetical protein
MLLVNCIFSQLHSCCCIFSLQETAPCFVPHCLADWHLFPSTSLTLSDLCRPVVYPQAVSVLIATHPALLEMSPNTLKARMESLAALFDVPAAAAAQLLLRHPGLAAIPPNVTITRAKGLSMGLRCSMARAGELIAKVRSRCLGGSSRGCSTCTVCCLDVAYVACDVRWLQSASFPVINCHQLYKPAAHEHTV